MLLFAGLGYCLFVPPSWSDMEVYNVILHPFIVSAPMWCGKWSRKRKVVGRHWARKKQTYWKTATDSTWRLNPWPMTSSTWTTVSRCDSNHCVQWNTSNKDWIILVSSTFQKSIFFLFHDIARSAKLLSCTSPAYTHSGVLWSGRCLSPLMVWIWKCCSRAVLPSGGTSSLQWRWNTACRRDRAATASKSTAFR